MPKEELIKGNRLDEIFAQVDGKQVVCGYRLYTGPLGTETEDESYCGDSRVLEFYKKGYKNLAALAQGSCELYGWDAWLLTHEVPDDPDTDEAGLAGYTDMQDLPPNPSGKNERAVAKKLKAGKKSASSKGKKSRKEKS